MACFKIYFSSPSVQCAALYQYKILIGGALAKVYIGIVESEKKFAMIYAETRRTKVE